jgi:DNA-binding transcriptional ArsR family regulator
MKVEDAASRLEALGNPTRLRIYRTLVKAGDPGLPVGKLQIRLGVPASTLSHHLKTLMIVGLITQERDATTLYCKANYAVMRGLVGFLVEECCTQADCASIRKQADTAA